MSVTFHRLSMSYILQVTCEPLHATSTFTQLFFTRVCFVFCASTDFVTLATLPLLPFCPFACCVFFGALLCVLFFALLVWLCVVSCFASLKPTDKQTKPKDTSSVVQTNVGLGGLLYGGGPSSPSPCEGSSSRCPTRSCFASRRVGAALVRQLFTQAVVGACFHAYC